MSGPSAIRLTGATVSVLEAFLEDPDGRFYGFELLTQAKIKSGTLYPMLARLERVGWLSSAWEDVDPARVRRPRRRYYVLTPKGLLLSASELERHRKSGKSASPGFQPGSLAPGPAW